MNIHLVLNGEQQGPFTPDEVRKLLAEGKATPATLAWHEGLADWVPVSTVLTALPSAAGSPPPPVAPAAQKKGLSGCALTAIIVACVAVVGLPVFACLAGIALGPITQGIKQAKESASMQQSRAIALAMFSYSMDNNGNYPTGQSSTEVFQKLLDGNYISTPDTFYVAMPGKVKPTTGKKLTAANVCFDVTANVTAQSPDTLPLVFLTGYTIDYTAGGNATPNSALSVPFPGATPRSGGISVAYKSNKAFFMNCVSGGIIPHIVPADFQPGTTTYRQLTP